MARARRQFSAEYKREAVRLVEEGRSVLDVARSLGGRADMLRKWRRQLIAAPTAQDAFPGHGKLTSQDEEIRRLRRELEVARQERDFFEASDGVLRQGVAVRYACIHRHTSLYTVALMCRVLRVSRPGYYAWRRRPPSARARANGPLLTAIRRVHHQSRARYGSPRITRALQAQGHQCSEARVARLMRGAGIAAKRRRRFRVTTTDSRHGEPVAPNRLQRQFAVATIPGRDRGWASDITYVPTQEGWLYLAVVLDLASRRVIGWAMRHTLERGLTLAALQMALAQRQPGPGVLHHSDRGRQYACGDYQALLARHQMGCSMSRKGDCFDNAVVESFFATLKTELVEDACWPTREVARSALFEYIEMWYNRERRHSSLDYRSPVQYEVEQLRHAA